MINLSIAEPESLLRPRICVVGVGGAGGNAINNMIRSGLEGCDFVAANTDAQALGMSLAPRKIQLGTNLSRGLGAGSRPEIGRAAAEEQMDDIIALLEGSDMLFVTAGMGGGTGTGAAPVVARAARESGILTVGVVTKPFHFEGNHRMRQAESGIADLQQYVDTLIVIPNQNLFRIANERTTFAEAFRLADEVLNCGVRGITDLMVMPGFMNLDFADVKTVMGEMGKAMMGTGEAEGEGRAVRAAEAAISNPLLDDVSMRGARGVLINVTGGMDMTLFEMDLAANRIREEVDPDAQIKVGSTLCEELNGRIRVSVIATGIDAALAEQEKIRIAAASGGSGGRASAQVSNQTATPRQQAQPSASAQPQIQQQQFQQQPQQQPQPQQSAPQVQAQVQAQSQTQAQQPTYSRMEAPSAPPAETRQPPEEVVTSEPIAPITVQPVLAPAQSQPVKAATSSVSAPYFSVPVSANPQAMQQSATAQPQSQQSAQQFSQSRAAQQPQPQAGFYVRPQQPQQTVQPRVQPSAPPQQPKSVEPRAVAAASEMSSTSGNGLPRSGEVRMTQLTSAPAQAPASASSGTNINRRSQSLFTRITGFGMVRQSSMQEEDEIMDEAEQQRAASAKLGVDPSDRPIISGETTESMEIPAFLRRQTNH